MLNERIDYLPGCRRTALSLVVLVIGVPVTLGLFVMGVLWDWEYTLDEGANLGLVSALFLLSACLALIITATVLGRIWGTPWWGGLALILGMFIGGIGLIAFT